MNRAAIFGCGTGGKRACMYLGSKYRVVTFLDNNRQAHGSRVCGIPVNDPGNFDYQQVEHVFIASMYFDAILVQLLTLGVPSSKIEEVSDQILMNDQPKRRAFGALRRAFYLPFRLLR